MDKFTSIRVYCMVTQFDILLIPFTINMVLSPTTLVNEYLCNPRFDNQPGVYIIRCVDSDLLCKISTKLLIQPPSTSSPPHLCAYVGKANNLKKRGKEEMGWANFEAATFVRKMGIYLGLDIADKRNKMLRDATRDFICSCFTIECIPLGVRGADLLMAEQFYIDCLRPCLNVKKVHY